MIVLGIESSCDETSLAIARENNEIVSSIVSSQVDIHARFGGVVPEIASRNHLESMPSLLDKTLEQAGMTLKDVQGIAVTARPGLIGALLVGVQFAKSLSWALQIPYVGTHHIEAHLYAAHIIKNQPEPEYPYVGLVVSGGHTSLFKVKGVGDVEQLGNTRDDAAGEAFDKVAKLLNIGYPGGPIIDKLARLGDPNRFEFPKSMRSRESLDFSFSGLKTAVRLHLAKNPPQNETDVHDVCAGVEKAIAEILAIKTAQALDFTGLSSLVVAGGVAANTGTRLAINKMAEEKGVKAVFPPLSLCTDNAAMVAALGRRYLISGVRSSLFMNAEAYRPLGAEGVSPAGD